MKCTACDATLVTGSSFCLSCGSPITQDTCPENEAPVPAAAQQEPERRQVTVMFCDLIGSTQLSERYDPEDFRSVIMAYQSEVANASKEHQGYVEGYVGDGMLIYFGYPEAHENYAEHAVLAALDVVDRVSSIKVQIGGEQIDDLQVRIGIATGLVIVGDVKSEGMDLRQSVVFGKTPNLAARIQGLAQPNSILVESHTYHLLEERFEFEDLGKHDIKGISEPTQVWRVTDVIDIQKRTEKSWLSAQTPMVNREDELDICLQYWNRANSGRSRFILVSGEAGIGKSRLVRELYSRVKSHPLQYFRFQCSSYHENSTFYPVIRYIERACDITAEDDNDQKLEKLKKLLTPLVDEPHLAVPLVASLMSISAGDKFPKLDMSPERRKETTLETLVNVLVSPRESRPILVVVEDVHWIDPSSEELLYRVITHLRNTRMLLIVTSRRAFPTRWTTQAGVISLTMDRLHQDNCVELIGNISGRGRLPDNVIQEIVTRSDGVPLFAEELTKTILASSVSDSEFNTRFSKHDKDVLLPESLQDSLLARLDQLNVGKRVAQLGAVIGREFSYELLAAVAGLPEDELNRALAQLRQTGLIYVVGAPPRATYYFKHALVRDAAYESLLKSKRRELHAAISTVIEKEFPQRVELEPELVARHYMEAGLTAQAISNWRKAGRKSMTRLAFSEAIEHVKRGLECVQHLEDPAQRAHAELGLRTLFGPALMAKHGYGATEVEQAYARARELCEQLPETPELFPVIFGLWGFHLVRAEYRVAYDLSRQLLTLGRAANDDGLMAEAHGTAGVTAIYLGKLTKAREHLELGMNVYDPEAHAAHAFQYGQDPWVACSAFHGQCMWLMGYADSGLKSSELAVSRAEDLGHHFSVTFSKFLHCLVLQLCRKPEALFAHAEAGLRLSDKQGFPHWVPRFKLFRAWALTKLGEIEKGVTEMQHCLDKSQPLSLFVRRPYYLALLAEATNRFGENAQSLRIIDDAINELSVFEDKWPVPEIHRIKGELILGSIEKEGKEVENSALKNFEKALELARGQSAKSWELRALLSLHKLHIKQGRPNEIRDALAVTTSWFTEGLDTRDLVEAKEVLSRPYSA